MDRVLICGSRAWSDALAIERVIQALVAEGMGTVVHGAAPGADAIAADVAARLGLRVEAHPPDFERDAEAARLLRNDQMLDSGPELVVAFGSDPGTEYTVAGARARRLDVLRAEDGGSSGSE